MSDFLSRTAQSIERAPTGKALPIGLALVFALGPVIVALVAVSGLSQELSLERLPGVLALVVAIELAVVALLAWLAGQRGARIDDGHLELLGAVYRRRVALADVDFERARVVDLREKKGFRPRLRTSGVGLPGIAVGHFRDGDGQRVFCVVSAARNLWLPLSDGSRLLFSAANPAGALDALRRAAVARVE